MLDIGAVAGAMVRDEVKPRIMSTCIKCSDMFAASFDGKDCDGYVPDFFPGNHYGDYVMLDIDVDTGRITNWKKPTAKQLGIFQ